MFCKHKWSVLSETETERPIHSLLEQGLSRAKNLPAEVFTAKYIVIVACDKCGKLHRFESKV